MIRTAISPLFAINTFLIIFLYTLLCCSYLSDHECKLCTYDYFSIHARNCLADTDRSFSAEEAVVGNIVESPLVGTFYSAPAEDAESFVKVGDRVEKGQTLGIVEAMKLMNEIESDYSGTVAEILVNNQEGVEYGQPLFRIV